MSDTFQEALDAIHNDQLALEDAIRTLHLGQADDEATLDLRDRLLEAIRGRNLGTVRQCGDTEPKLLAEPNTLRTAVLFAPGDTAVELLQLLLNYVKDVNIMVDEEAGTMLHLAAVRAACGCQAGPQLLDVLLSHRADVNTLNKNKETPLTYALLVQPFSEHTVELVSRLLTAGVDVHARDRIQRTALHNALGSNSYVWKAWRRQQGEEEEEHIDWVEHAKCQCDIIQHLVDCGAKVNVEDREGVTPLAKYMAEYREDSLSTMVIRKLCALGADINLATGLSGINSWLMAAYQRHLGALQVLHQYGANVNALNLKSRKNAVHTALEGTSMLQGGNRDNILQEVKQTVDYMVSAGVDLNHMDVRGRTPLHHYIADDKCVPDPQVVEYMLARGADYFTSDKYSESPLTSACKGQWTKVAYVLMQYGPGLCINFSGNPEPNPLHRMIVYGAVTRRFWVPRRKQETALIERCVRMLRVLLEAGYFITEEDLATFNNNAIAPQVVELLRYECSHPPSLARVCRCVVRHLLWDRLQQRVQLLPVPNRIKASILLKDLVPPFVS